MADNMEQYKKFGWEYNPDGYGVGGVAGVKHQGVVGWDNVTVGLAASVLNDVIMNNGVSSFDPSAIPMLEPIRAGRFIVKWLKIPPFFDVQIAGYIRVFLEKFVRGISGITDNQIGTVDGAPLGPTRRPMEFPGIYQQNNKGFTLSTMTCSGDGLGKLLKYWMYGMSDKDSGVSHMYGKNLRFHRSNYSGTLLYVFLGPTCRPDDIEFACIWHECFPISPDGDQKFNNQQMGEVGNLSEQEVEFSGLYDTGPIVSILAQYVVAASGLYGQSQFDTVLPAYMYDMFMGSSVTDAELKNAMNLNLRDQINKVIDDPVASKYTNYTSNVIDKHDELGETYGTGNSAIGNAVTFESQMESVRQPLSTRTNI